MTALFTSYVINRKCSDLTLKIMTQEKSNVANQLLSLIGLSPLESTISTEHIQVIVSDLLNLEVQTFNSKQICALGQ